MINVVLTLAAVGRAFISHVSPLPSYSFVNNSIETSLANYAVATYRGPALLERNDLVEAIKRNNLPDTTLEVMLSGEEPEELTSLLRKRGYFFNISRSPQCLRGGIGFDLAEIVDGPNTTDVETFEGRETVIYFVTKPSLVSNFSGEQREKDYTVTDEGTIIIRQDVIKRNGSTVYDSIRRNKEFLQNLSDTMLASMGPREFYGTIANIVLFKSYGDSIAREETEAINIIEKDILKTTLVTATTIKQDLAGLDETTICQLESDFVLKYLSQLSASERIAYTNLAFGATQFTLSNLYRTTASFIGTTPHTLTTREIAARRVLENLVTVAMREGLIVVEGDVRTTEKLKSAMIQLSRLRNEDIQRLAKEIVDEIYMGRTFIQFVKDEGRRRYGED
ncbi:MAG: hypothetical protein QW331_00775 [Candidatus Woesearchaeota archaeon]